MDTNNESLVCPESTIESANRRNFMVRAAVAATTVAVGGTLLDRASAIPHSYASSSICCLDSKASVVVDTKNCNDGLSLAPALLYGCATTGEGISSARKCGAANLHGLDFWTDFDKRMSITHCGNVGIGTVTPSSTLCVNGSLGVNGLAYTNYSLYVDLSNVNNGSSVHCGGLVFGYYPSCGGSGEGIASARASCSPNQYGLDFYTAQKKRMSITNPGNVIINCCVRIDYGNHNSGCSLTPGGIVFGCYPCGSGEGISSNRSTTDSKNQYGLDFYTAHTKRMSITNGGKVGIGTFCFCTVNDFQVLGSTLLTQSAKSSTLNVRNTGGGAGVCVEGSGDYAISASSACAGTAISGRAGVGVLGVSSKVGTGVGVQGCGTSGTGVVGNGKNGVAGLGTCYGIVGQSPCGVAIVAKGGTSAKNLQQWEKGCTVLSVVNKCGWLGVATSDPASALQVQGNALVNGNAATSCPGYAIRGNSSGAMGVGVFGYSPCNIGVKGNGAYGIYGCGSIGVYGSSFGAFGVYGNSCQHIGVLGQGAINGIRGTSSGCSGAGVVGVAGAASVTPLVAIGAATQTADLQRWEKGCSTVSVVNKCGWFGIGTEMPGTTLQVNGSVAANIVSTNKNSYKMDSTCYAVIATAAITVILPKAKTAKGMIVMIKSNTTAGAVTVEANTGDTIDGGSSVSLASQFNGVQLISNGSKEWFVIGTTTT